MKETEESTMRISPAPTMRTSSSLQQKQRLKRLDWVFSDRPLYFVTACVQGRRPVLANKLVFDAFQDFCDTGLERGFFVGRFVLMPDHLHFFYYRPAGNPSCAFELDESVEALVDESAW